MRFASLGSGSRGNATLIEASSTRLLLDCGFAAREVEQRLAALGVDPTTLDAILVTHEHQDHIRGVGPLARRYRIPVWTTRGTCRSGRLGKLPELNLIQPHQPEFDIGTLRVRPYAVPHDAREPVQFTFRGRDRHLGVLTDTGLITPHIVESLGRCDALLLECNHDTLMLAEGPYPPALQRRVGGELGHLSNRQAASLLEQLDRECIQHLVAAHLSEKNNHPDLARTTLCHAAPDIASRIAVTAQDDPTGWFCIE